MDQSTIVAALKEHEAQKNQQGAGILVILVVLGLLWWGVSSLMTSPEERAHKDCLESAYRTGLGLDDSLRRQIQDRCERTHLG